MIIFESNKYKEEKLKMDRIRVNQLLEDIATELNIPESTLKKAIISYDTLAEYINNNSDFSVNIFPQGSVRLGTAIKPIYENDDYDIDLVCFVKEDISKPSTLKEMIGDVLKNSDRYSKLLLPEGRRCWTLKYADEAHFHMDVLPAKHGPNQSDEPLTITDKTNGQYSFLSSNPKGYAKWFDRKQRDGYNSHTFSIEKINSPQNKTTLQKTVQLLKRHRDIMYSNKSEHELEYKPISIVITTIAAELYDGGQTLLSAIERFANSWENCISKDNCGNFILKNPIDANENFVDKWIEHPERRNAFFEWTNQLKYDLKESNFTNFTDKVKESEHLQSMFGEKIVTNTYKKLYKKEEKLYIDALQTSAGITTNETATPVKNHTFYGK